jgi:hypothetical protein
MNWPSNNLALSKFSDRASRIGLYLPFAAVMAFALLGIYSRLFHGFDSGEVSVPSLSILQSQRAYLVSQGLVQGLNVDFIMFEAFIWIASIVGLVRLLTGLSSAQVLDSSRVKVETYEKQRLSPARFLIFTVLLPVGILGSLNFAFASHSVQVHSLMEYSPRTFLCLSTFIFCGSVSFLVQCLLILTWIMCLSE